MKKKGLIISTVVMVVVLIASLTTATYAWFSAQAQATVDDLSITTTAAKGLQIAMTNKKNKVDDIVSGDLSFANNKWEGTTGWGTSLGFGNIEVKEIEHAITYLKIGDKIKEFDGFVKAQGNALDATISYYNISKVDSLKAGDSVVGLLEKDANTDKYNYTTDVKAQNKADETNTLKDYFKATVVKKPEATQINTYYTVQYKAETTITEETQGYYQPTGYDKDTLPTGYRKVAANQAGTYYSLSMAVMNMKNVAKIGFNIEVVPGGTSNLATPAISATQPGMAAASRIDIRVAEQPANGNVTEKGKAQLAPFSAYKLTTTSTMDSGTNFAGGVGYKPATDGALNGSGKYIYVLSGEQTNVVANTVYYVDMVIWVEGTDRECDNSTTGSSMKFLINFAYAEGDGEIAWNWENGNGDNATVVTLTNA